MCVVLFIAYKNYKQYCKPLEKNDMVKANSLLRVHFYDEVMEFMLEKI